MAESFVNVKLSKLFDRKIVKNLDTLTSDPATMLEINNLLAKKCDPYVPFLNGPLSQTHVVTPESVRYIQPYARYQYYGLEFNHTLDYHPKATAFWDKAMLAEKGKEFNKEVKQILKRRLKELNG
jgi:hypothetical protein